MGRGPDIHQKLHRRAPVSALPQIFRPARPDGGHAGRARSERARPGKCGSSSGIGARRPDAVAARERSPGTRRVASRGMTGAEPDHSLFDRVCRPDRTARRPVAAPRDRIPRPMRRARRHRRGGPSATHRVGSALRPRGSGGTPRSEIRPIVAAVGPALERCRRDQKWMRRGFSPEVSRTHLRCCIGSSQWMRRASCRLRPRGDSRTEIHVIPPDPLSDEASQPA